MNLQTHTPSLPVSQKQDHLASARQKPERASDKKIIRDLGLKVTSQRLLILETIRSGTSHFTAQDIFEFVIQKNPDVGFATVYRFLRNLTDRQFVSEVRMGGMPARYEWAEKDHHDHLTCTSCSKIVEFENTEIERLQLAVAKQYGFKLTHHVLELYGLCPACQAKENLKK